MTLLSDIDRDLIEGLRAGVCTGPGPCDITPIGAGKNWVNEVGGLPLYIRAIAQALLRSGHSERQAIEMAVGTVKRWAAGGGKVTAATRARAAKAVAEWEAKKAAAHGSRDVGPVVESSSAGGLLPRGPSPRMAAEVEARLAVADGPHAFRGRDLERCGLCGQPATAAIHHTRVSVAGVRAGGAYSAGHPFFGNQYDALANAQTPQQLAALVNALRGPSGAKTGGGGGAGKKAAGGGAGKAKAAAKHQASVAKAAAAKQASTVKKQATTVARLKKAVTVAQTKAATARDQAAHAKAGSAAQKQYAGRADAWEKVALQAQDALAQAQGHRSDDKPGGDAAPLDDGTTEGDRHAGPGHHPVQTGHVAGNPVRARRALKASFGAAADQLETGLQAQLATAVGRTEKRTLSAFKGGRGRKVRRQIRAAQPPSPDESQPPPPDAASIFDQTFLAGELARALTAFYEQAAQVARQRIADQLALGETVPSTGTAAANLLARANQLAGNVAADVFNRIQQALADGVAAGEGIPKLSERIRHVFDTTRSRAELIARTETTSALNQAASDYANALPPGTVGRKEWLAVHDLRTRPAHRVADGQTVPLSHPFLVGGFPMQHPGDPTAPPSEVCNCRCSVLYHPGPLTSAKEAAA